jgi:hypothetical protein
MFIMAKLKDGSFIKSDVSPVILTSFKDHLEIENFPSADLVESVETGLPLKKVVLNFKEVITEVL